MVRRERPRCIVGEQRAWHARLTRFAEALKTPEECAVRETREETGLEVTVERFVGIYSHP